MTLLAVFSIINDIDLLSKIARDNLVGVYLFKVNNGNQNNVLNLFRVNSKDTRTTSLTFLLLILNNLMSADNMVCSNILLVNFFSVIFTVIIFSGRILERS